MKAHFGSAIRFFVETAVATSLGLALSGPAHAVDGCRLLLCLAGNWQNISECAPTVRQALRDVARGHAWPTCNMAGNSASGNQYAAPERCPEQYISSVVTDDNGRVIASCPFSGVIHVAVDGQAWSRTWWSPSGDSVIEWLPAAKAAFARSAGAMDERFAREHAAWVVSEQIRLAAEAAAAAGGGQGGGR